MYTNYSPSSDYIGTEQDLLNNMAESVATHPSGDCSYTRDQEDIKPTICTHGNTVERCTVPECATFEISKILDNLQNFDRGVEGTSPLAADEPVFNFEGPQPTSPSQWEDFNVELTTMPTSALPGHPTGMLPLGFTQQQPQCTASAQLLRDGGHTANQRASESPGLQMGCSSARTPTPDAVLRCRIQRNRHPSSSMSEGYSSDHTVPSPSPRSRQFTAAEIEKRERRKEQNRRAARKCRIKKRAQNLTMATEFSNLECENTQLKYRIQLLEKEKKELDEILQVHMATCNLRLPPD